MYFELYLEPETCKLLKWKLYPYLPIHIYMRGSKLSFSTFKRETQKWGYLKDTSTKSKGLRKSIGIPQREFFCFLLFCLKNKPFLLLFSCLSSLFLRGKVVEFLDSTLHKINGLNSSKLKLHHFSKVITYWIN